MSTVTTLKLVKPDPRESDSIAFDRRSSVRRVISGRVTAWQASSQRQPHDNKICSLQLVNISDTGLGAITQEPVDPTTSITVFFPPHGPEHGLDKYGRVVRCEERDGRHDIGIQFVNLTAEASRSA